MAAAVPPGAEPERPEPELITHRMHNGTGDEYDDGYDPPPGYNEAQMSASGLDSAAAESGATKGGKGKKPLTPAQRKKRRWKIIRRSLYAFVGLFLVLPAAAFAITYFLVEVPSPDEVSQNQAKVVTYFYADGETEMGRDIPPDGGNRILLQPGEVPDVVKHAVYAAEDASFETNPGFDLIGILRAAYNQVTGGVGGGSTITQQYIKVATENDEYSVTRKWTELVKAFKMSNEQSKEEIITAYLNTIYFGRGAYGIKTASQAYFGKDPKDLSASEAAQIAGMIQQPSRTDDETVLKKRWKYVMDRMVANNWLSKEERDKAEPPKLIPLEEAKPDTITGAERFIQQRVNEELAEKGYPEEKLRAGGYNVYLTIDQHAQDAAEQAVAEVMEGEPEELKEALTAVDPETGAVRAYYGGPFEAEGNQYDWAAAQRNPGSAFKPFDLVALLHNGKGIGETYDGSSPREFGNRQVRNASNMQCEDPCTVAEAMEKSINTVFYDFVVNEVGPKAVAEAATQAGIPEHGDGIDGRPTMPHLDGNISIGGGDIVVSPLHMASAYASFASGGVRHDTHFVAKLTTNDGEVVFDETSEIATEGEPAFDEDPETSKQIAGNVTRSLAPVLSYSDLECAEGRSCAGKTGTHQYVDPSGAEVDANAETWMVGYSRQISAAVWVGTGQNKPAQGSDGANIYGSMHPGRIWKAFMDAYHEGKPMMEFDEVALIGPDPSEVEQPPPPSDPPEDTDESSTESTPPSSTTEDMSIPNTSLSITVPEVPTESREPWEPTDPGRPPDDPGDDWPFGNRGEDDNP